jgi:hypothetical protein
MNVRSLDLLDIPLLSRYRREVLPLNSALLLTRGSPLGARAMLSYLNPRRTIYTAVASENGRSLMGQVTLKEEETSAQLTFLAPAQGSSDLILPLLDHLAAQAGGWGAFHLLAEVDESSLVFQLLRQAGFAMYAWQRAWRLPLHERKGEDRSWREAAETDWPAIQSLHGQIIPALLQPVDALPKQVSGLVCRSAGDLQAYGVTTSGPSGIWVRPLIPPDSDCGSRLLTGLAELYRRPVYVCVRSYQAWLENVLADLGAEAGARQAVMVKRLAKTVKELQPLPVMEKVLAKAKPAAPVSRVKSEE